MSSSFIILRLSVSKRSSSKWIDLSIENPLAITYDMINTMEVKTNASFILIVEKVVFFLKLSIGWNIQTTL